MNERFTYLVSKYLDKGLSEKEKAEFDIFLIDPLCADYLKKSEKAERIIDKGLQGLISDVEKKVPPPNNSEDLFENVFSNKFLDKAEADISEYGEEISEETKDAVRLMHHNLLAQRKKAAKWRYAGIAASILFLLVLLQLSQKPPTPQQLFEKYYKPYEFLIIRRAINADEIYSDAVDNYMQGNYEFSSKLCRNSIATQLPDPKVHFLYGLNLMQQDSLQSAIKQFNIASSLPLAQDSDLTLLSNWYKSLCHLALSQPDSAILSLEMIEDVDTTMTPDIEVKKLLKDLETIKNR